MEITRSTEYDRLLARHHAMRLRRQILAPAAPPARTPAGGRPGHPYDGTGDQRLILRHLEQVTPFDGLIGHLYDDMFLRRPYLRALFPASMEFQREHLERMFRYLIEHLHRPDHMTAVLHQLGSDHRKLGVRPAHYAAFEEALRAGLRTHAGPGWSEEAERAWMRMLRFAVGAMVDGAESALTEPPYWPGTVVGHEPRGRGTAVLRIRTGEPYPYRAGQYATVESPLLPHSWRPYSIACAPRADRVLEFHVRRTGPGGVSEALVDRTAVGDPVRLGPARGGMTVDGGGRDLLLVAGGTGLAPMKAIVEELTDRRVRGQRVHLLVGARGRADLYDWEALAESGPGRPWLDLVPVLGHDPRPDGRRAMDEALDGRDWSEHLACVSGPPGMVDAVRTRLLASGLPADRIRHDPVTTADHG
ncbi:globin domain-containing protein [Kitasatospora camelliae]|uniref:nitric oxide dioxygenase n=1 Tax=Kitasatospora camelliae TaxID=3156397 RepID=A0AAU8K557_9ACTN